MKRKNYFFNSAIVIFVCLLTAFIACSSRKKIELASLGDEKIWLYEFEDQFLRTVNNLDSAKKTSIEQREQFLDLLIKFRLKVKDARDRGLLESDDIQKDLNEYKKNFLSTYLVDKEIIIPAIKEVYDRRKEEIRASHILINLPQNPSSEDSIAAYNKAEQIIERLKNGEDFRKVASETSEDPTAAQNGGDLYYFTGGMTVPEFEDAVYSMKVGEFSKKPVRTQFGLHIIYVTDRQPRKESVSASHILIQIQRDSLGNIIDSIGAYNKANDILNRVRNGEDFATLAKEFSMDPGSSQRGGDLGYFERRRMVPEFDSAAFSMKKGEISDLIRTQFGWHIIKVNDIKEVAPFEVSKDKLKSEFSRSPQFKKLYNEYLEKVRKRFKFEIIPAGIDFLLSKSDTSQTVAVNGFATKFTGADNDFIVAEYNEGEIKVSNVLHFLETNREFANLKPTRDVLEDIIKGSSEIILLDKMAKRENVEKDDEYKEMLTEYENGLLSFKVDQEELWSKIQVSEEDIKNYYESNKEKYSIMDGEEKKYKTIDEVRSEISNQLQQDKFKELENAYITKLKEKYPVVIKREVLEKAFTESR